MTNKLSHFKFTKKEKPLNKTVNERNRENDSLKKERKYSELLIRILLSSKPYNNKIDNKKNIEINNTKRKSLFNNNDKFLIKYKNKNKFPKAYNNFNTLNNSQKTYSSIINKYKTEKKNLNFKSRITNKKIDEFKEIIKHNLNLYLETKFFFLKKNNSSIRKRIKLSPPKKNYNMSNKNNKLNIKNSQKKNLNISAYDKKNKIQKKIERIKTTENINKVKFNKIDKKQNTSPKKSKLMNYFFTNKLSQNKYNKFICLTNREKNHKELTDTENKKSNNKLNNKNIVYINLNKNNTATKLRTENKEKKFELIKGNKDSVKHKLLILIDDCKQKKGTELNNMTFYLSPKRLIDQIRTIKKLNIINKSSI